MFVDLDVAYLVRKIAAKIHMVKNYVERGMVFLTVMLSFVSLVVAVGEGGVAQSFYYAAIDRGDRDLLMLSLIQE